MFKKLLTKGTKKEKDGSFNKVQQEAIELGIDLNRLPKHIAIIMDGNGRWGVGKELGRLLGHREGYRSLRKILLCANDLGIKYLTVYAFSTENWTRPGEEVKHLFSLIERAARDELRVMCNHNVQIRTSGRIKEVPESLRNALEFGIDITKDNTGMVFTLAINYGGRAEIVDSVKQIVANGSKPEDITEELIRSHLYNPDIPDPELMIRTSGEMRWSNFLLWESAYTELFVTPVHWPDFKPSGLMDAIKSFQKRDRRYGGV